MSDLNTLADQHSQSAPASEDAIEAERRRLEDEAKQNAADTPQPTESANVGDDYERDANGNIRFCKDGVTPRRKRGAKKKVIQSSSPEMITPETPGIVATPPTDYVRMGQTVAQATVALPMMVFGDEWAASREELDGMADAWAKAFEHYGIADIPPYAAVVLCVGFYAIPRLRGEKTAAKIESWKAKWKNRKGEKQ